VQSQMLETALVEDLNQLACPEAQERYARDPERAREALNRLRFLDFSELPHCQRQGWLGPDEVDLIERLRSFARTRLVPVPDHVDPVEFTRAHEGWQSVRERALELVVALDAFVDVGVAGWGRQYARS
jgi:hypothetical protein